MNLFKWSAYSLKACTYMQSVYAFIHIIIIMLAICLCDQAQQKGNITMRSRDDNFFTWDYAGLVDDHDCKDGMFPPTSVDKVDPNAHFIVMCLK